MTKKRDVVKMVVFTITETVRDENKVPFPSLKTFHADVYGDPRSFVEYVKSYPQLGCVVELK